MAVALRAPESEARKIRQRLWNNEGRIRFPVDPFAIAEKLNISVQMAPLDQDTAGFIHRRAHGPVEVFLNREDHPVRQRFTLAHEIGHFLQHQDEGPIGYVDKRDELSTAGLDPDEIWANQFAAALLMPESIVKKWWAMGKKPEQMKREFRVSAPALTNRLKNLGLLNA